MVDKNKATVNGQGLNIGIYGCTRAGKTRFLFQLLRGWERNRRILSQSEACQKFLATVEGGIDQFTGSLPTAAKTEGIRVKVRRGDDEKPWELLLRDLKGESLSPELDRIESPSPDDSMPAQVCQCNAFLFFFDPTSSENREEIDKHHQRELKRAALFIDHILKDRQNRYLPIIFVQTHLDIWEHDDAARAKAGDWFDQVNVKLQTLYSTHLRNHWPLTLVERSKTSISVSSVRDGEGEKVVEQLHDLVEDARKYADKDRRKVRSALWAGAVFVTSFFGFVVWQVATTGYPHRGRSPGVAHDRTAATDMTESDVLVQLDECERLLGTHPRGPRLPSPDEAKKVNHHVQWLSSKVALSREGAAPSVPVSEKTSRRMHSVLDAAATQIEEKTGADGIPLTDRAQLLAAYLEDLPDCKSVSSGLGRAQSLYWTLQRALVVEQVASVLRRRHEVASPAADTLTEVIIRLRSLEQEVARCKVFGTEPRQNLVQEIQTAVTYCEDRKNSKSYGASFRIISVTFTSEKRADLNWRSLTLRSPGQLHRDYRLESSRRSDNECSFTAEKPSYRMSLGLGSPVTCDLSVYDDSARQWRKLHEFDLTKDQGPLTPLGLPLPRPGQSEVIKLLQWEGYELKLEFSGFPPPPPLLWNAAGVSMKERKL
jgi:hypothetical protein